MPLDPSNAHLQGGWEGFEQNLLWAAAEHLHPLPSAMWGVPCKPVPIDPPILVGDLTQPFAGNLSKETQCLKLPTSSSAASVATS